MARFDQKAERAFDRLRGNPAADRVFYTASELGDFGLIWVILATLKALRKSDDLAGALRMIAAMGLESVLVNDIIKSAFRRTRPPWEVERPLRVRRPLTSSFPSGDATSATSAAIILSEDDELLSVYVAMAAVVVSSWIFVKIHYHSDVGAGVASGRLIG